MSKRLFNRYPGIGGLPLAGLCAVATRHGMTVRQAFKPPCHAWNEIALHGTREQMAEVDAEWRAGGSEVPPRRPAGTLGLHPRTEYGLRRTGTETQ